MPTPDVFDMRTAPCKTDGQDLVPQTVTRRLYTRSDGQWVIEVMVQPDVKCNGWPQENCTSLERAGCIALRTTNDEQNMNSIQIILHNIV